MRTHLFYVIIVYKRQKGLYRWLLALCWLPRETHAYWFVFCLLSSWGINKRFGSVGCQYQGCKRNHGVSVCVTYRDQWGRPPWLAAYAVIHWPVSSSRSKGRFVLTDHRRQFGGTPDSVWGGSSGTITTLFVEDFRDTKTHFFQVCGTFFSLENDHRADKTNRCPNLVARTLSSQNTLLCFTKP